MELDALMCDDEDVPMPAEYQQVFKRPSVAPVVSGMHGDLNLDAVAKPYIELEAKTGNKRCYSRAFHLVREQSKKAGRPQGECSECARAAGQAAVARLCQLRST